MLLESPTDGIRLATSISIPCWLYNIFTAAAAKNHKLLVLERYNKNTKDVDYFDIGRQHNPL